MIKKKPFTAYTLESERTREMISVPLNKEEREILNDFKEKIGEKKDATALKLGFLTGANVIHLNFSGDIRVQLFKKKYSKHDKTKPKEE